MPPKRSGEFELIARYFAPLAARVPGAFGLTDDAAFLDVPDGHELVAKTDSVVAFLTGRASAPGFPLAGHATRCSRCANRPTSAL